LTAEDQTEDQPVEKVKEFKAKIKAADAILIHSYARMRLFHPGRPQECHRLCFPKPHEDNVFAHKPVAMMGASPTAF
jgi:chromate reductase